MNGAKTVKIISNSVYSLGAAAALGLAVIALFGSGEAVNPMAMIPFTWREQAFIWLAFGAIPMLPACMAVYHFNAARNSSHKARNFILIFLPGFVCAGCALFVLGVVAVGMINSFMLSGALF